MRRMRTLVALLAALLTLVALAQGAAAHTRVPIMDGEFTRFQVTVGWISEPPFVDQPNAAEIRVEKFFESGSLAPGATFSFTFSQVGAVPYHCHFHEDEQEGMVVVESAEHGHPPVTHAVAIGDNTFTPENLTIRAGDTVVWTNEGGVAHTVSFGHGDEDGHGHGHDAAPPTMRLAGLEEALDAELSIAGQTKSLNVQPRFRDPGMYLGRVIPTVAGVYTLRVSGTIEGVPFAFEEPIQEVEDGRLLAFPQSTATRLELQSQLDHRSGQVTELGAKVDDLENQRNILFGVVVLALVLAVLSMIMAGSAKRHARASGPAGPRSPPSARPPMGRPPQGPPRG